MPGSYKAMAAGRHKAKHPHRRFGPGHHSGLLKKSTQRRQKSSIVRKGIKLKRSVNYKDKRY